MKKPKHRILVIEDNRETLHELKDILQREGYDVDAAENGRRAINLWKKNAYDVILADLRIPEIDGREVIETIKDKQPYAQIVILSGQGKEEDWILAINKHIFKYLEKPADQDVIISTVAEALAERDPLVLSLERFSIDKPDEPFLLVGKKKLTAKQLFDEVRRGTDFGRNYHKNYKKSLVDFAPLHTSESLEEQLGIKGVIE